MPYLFLECGQVVSLLLFPSHNLKNKIIKKKKSVLQYYLLCISKAQQNES